jgi:hypothetical protein
VHKIGNGKMTQFWNGVWLTSSPLRVCFPRLFQICYNAEASVAKCAELDWQFNFRRMLDPEALLEWTQLQELLRGVQTQESEDEVIWGLSSSKKFTTGSLYKCLTNGGMSSKMAEKFWKCQLPLKIRIFLTGQQLKCRNWKGRETCTLCGEVENANHLLFTCPLAVFVWSFVREALGWDGFPNSMEDLVTTWLPKKFGVSCSTALACVAGLAWALWITRNKFCIQKKFPDNPIDVIYVAASFVQKWKWLMKEVAKGNVETMVASVLKLRVSSPSDPTRLMSGSYEALLTAPSQSSPAWVCIQLSFARCSCLNRSLRLVLAVSRLNIQAAGLAVFCQSWCSLHRA